MHRFPSRRCFALTAIAASAFLSGCSSGGGGFLGINPGPTGDITITNATTGTVLTTSATHPFMVNATQLRFAIGISEKNFGGPYAVTNVGSTNVPTAANGGNDYPYYFNQPCFEPHFQNDPMNSVNIVTFSGDNANSDPYAYPHGAPAGATGAGGNPCHSGELETWAIQDSKSHTVYFYDEEP